MSKPFFLYRLTVIKALGYRLLTTAITVGLVLFFTGSAIEWKILGLLAIVDFVLKTVLYIAWDRLWFSIFKKAKKQHAVREAQDL